MTVNVLWFVFAGSTSYSKNRFGMVCTDYHVSQRRNNIRNDVDFFMNSSNVSSENQQVKNKQSMIKLLLIGKVFIELEIYFENNISIDNISDIEHLNLKNFHSNVEFKEKNVKQLYFKKILSNRDDMSKLSIERVSNLRINFSDVDAIDDYSYNRFINNKNEVCIILFGFLFGDDITNIMIFNCVTYQLFIFDKEIEYGASIVHNNDHIHVISFRNHYLINLNTLNILMSEASLVSSQTTFRECQKCQSFNQINHDLCWYCRSKMGISNCDNQGDFIDDSSDIPFSELM